MISLGAMLSFLSSGGTPVSGGSVIVPDEPYVEPEPPVADPTDPDGDTGDTGDGTPPDSDPAPMAPTLPLVATARWHPQFSDVALDGDRVASATDLTGLADATASAGQGPLAMVDGLGRPFWRFAGDAYLQVAQTLTLNSRNMSVFMVGRFHRISTRSQVFSIGTEASGLAPNTVSPALEATVNQHSVPLLRAFSKPTNSTFPSPEKMITGAQMQVIGATMRHNNEGGNTQWMNEHSIPTAHPLNYENVTGAEIGRFAYRPGASGKWGVFDLYEMIVYDTNITDAEGDTLVADLMATYDIPSITNQLVLEGDSIMQGTDDVTSGRTTDMILTEPGAALIGGDWRVVNMASNGSKIANLINRRDAVAAWPTLTLSGQNVMAFELGRNDITTTTGTTPAEHYDNVVAYLTDGFGDPAQSILARGWDVRIMANIASAPALQPNIEAYRALLRDPALAIDTDTEAGGTYPEQVTLIDTDLITTGGDTVFATSDDAADQSYYVGDSTHPNLAGTALRASGGDDPARGISFGL